MVSSWTIGVGVISFWNNDQLYLMVSQLVPHIVGTIFSCFPHVVWLNHFMYNRCISHGHIYIAVDTILYSYTLPIDYFSYLFLSLCLSCNLSQAKGCNNYCPFYLGYFSFFFFAAQKSSYFTISVAARSFFLLRGFISM